mmetsp:Transcript_14094/g.42456  ORF Transcript_14094/g.42456 Transcript_14094/m.42456 type:complete len:343 (+) Transcript_14094:11-1039(+)
MYVQQNLWEDLTGLAVHLSIRLRIPRSPQQTRTFHVRWACRWRTLRCKHHQKQRCRCPCQRSRRRCTRPHTCHRWHCGTHLGRDVFRGDSHLRIDCRSSWCKCHGRETDHRRNHLRRQSRCRRHTCPYRSVRHRGRNLRIGFLRTDRHPSHCEHHVRTDLRRRYHSRRSSVPIHVAVRPGSLQHSDHRCDIRIHQNRVDCLCDRDLDIGHQSQRYNNLDLRTSRSQTGQRICRHLEDRTPPNHGADRCGTVPRSECHLHSSTCHSHPVDRPDVRPSSDHRPRIPHNRTHCTCRLRIRLDRRQTFSSLLCSVDFPWQNCDCLPCHHLHRRLLRTFLRLRCCLR